MNYIERMPTQGPSVFKRDPELAFGLERFSPTVGQVQAVASIFLDQPIPDTTLRAICNKLSFNPAKVDAISELVKGWNQFLEADEIDADLLEAFETYQSFRKAVADRLIEEMFTIPAIGDMNGDERKNQMISSLNNVITITLTI